MKRILFVVAAGLIGILLGVGLSFAADAIAGSELSDPVPLGITPAVAAPEPTKTAEHERPSPSETPKKDDVGDDQHVDPSGSAQGPGETESPQTSGSSDSGSGESLDSGGSDDSSGGSDESGHDEGDD